MFFLFLFIGILLKILFFVFYRYRVYGVQNYYQGGAIIAPNHVSFLDPPLIGISWPEETHYLARASLFRPFLLGKILKTMNAHPVHGSSQDLTSFKTICQLLNQGKKVVIFPEGVRSREGQLQPIKTGVAMLALRTQCPIIPAYIDGSFEAWPRSRRWPKLTGRIACVFGKPILVEPYMNMDKKQAQEALTHQLQQSIEDLRAWFKAGAVGNPP